MGLFSCIFLKSYLYFLIFWILDFLGSLESSLNSNNKKGKKAQLETMLLNFIYIYLGELLSGFLVLYTKLRMNFLKRNEPIHTSKTDIQLIYNDLSLKDNITILIMLATILDFLGRNYVIFYYLFFGRLILQQHHIKWVISIDILARIFFCRIILKIKLYKHHRLSICICSIGFFIMAIFTLTIIFENNGKYNKVNAWIYIILVIITKFFFSLGDTLSKIILTYKFILPHYLMFYKSSICSVFYLILIPILFLTSKISFSNIKDIFSEGGRVDLQILLILFKMFSAFFKNLCVFKIIYIFTPIHVGFLNIVSCLYQILQYFFSHLEYLLFLICYVICLLVIGIGTLIFTEILVINCNGLNENTKVGLLLKEKLDQCPPNGTILSDYYENNNENSDSRNCSEDLMKNRKSNNTVLYNDIKNI